MPFVPITAKARKAPFSFGLLTRLFANQRANELLQNVEHARDGTHNALEVARGVAAVHWTGAVYELELTSDVITSVTRVSAGVIQLAINSGVFASKMVPRVTVMANGAEAVPYIHHVVVNSSSQVTVYLHALASLAGNIWNATDGSFAIALHSSPYQSGGSLVTAIDDAARGDTLGGAASPGDPTMKWNQLIANQAELRNRMLAEHTSAGAHNALEVARGAALFSYNGVGYDTVDSESVTSASAVSTGRARVALPAGYTTPLAVFAQADYDRQVGADWSKLNVVNIPRSQVTSSQVEAFLYQYSSELNTWAKADFDFALSIHTAPA